MSGKAQTGITAGRNGVLVPAVMISVCSCGILNTGEEFDGSGVRACE
jgi:hypothetical protein